MAYECLKQRCRSLRSGVPLTGIRDHACRGVLVAIALFLGVSPAVAQGVTRPGEVSIIVEELPENRYLDVIAELGDSGYRIVSVSRTLLNRMRIEADNGQHLREIIFSQAAGLVLRDVIVERY